MMNKNKMLLSAAAFNWAVALVFLFAGPFCLSVLGIDIPPSPVWLHFFSVLVAGFGLGYFLAAADPEPNKQIIFMGAAAKLSLCLTGIIEVALGNIAWTILLPLAIDFVYAMLFLKLISVFNPR